MCQRLCIWWQCPAKPSRHLSPPIRDATIWLVGRREVLVQLDDDLVDRLDRLAEQYGTNRSELLRRGAAAVLEAAERAEADRVLQDAYRRLPQDPVIVAAASRLASLTAPEW
jgi:Ribbon-helix-helix protein, copG family